MITLEGIFAGVVTYGIVHGIIKIVDNGGHWLLRVFKTERDAIIHTHVWQGHIAKLVHCTEGECHKLSPRQT